MTLCIVLYYLLLNMSGARRIKANYALVIFYTERLHESSTFVCLLRAVKKIKKTYVIRIGANEHTKYVS